MVLKLLHCCRLLYSPLDLIKVRMQLQGESQSHVPNPHQMHSLHPAFAFSSPSVTTGSLNFPHSPPPPPPLRVGPISVGIKIFQTEGVAALFSGAEGVAEGSRSGLFCGSRSNIVPNTTVEVVVPENALSSVHGEDGGNLNRIRQISGAEVVMRNPSHSKSEGMVVISGTPDQIRAAQSLLQAFIQKGK